jgi:hypothetical protein
MKMKIYIAAFLAVILMPLRGHASAGTDGANFLNIPVGAEPASFGAAYSALANNAYAPTWNPGGLGFVDVSQLAAQHLSYLENINYEYLGFAVPFGRRKGFGASVQYLGSGNIAATDATGNSIGNITAHYGAYNLSYGQALTDQLTLGVTGKLVEGKLDNVGATAYAADIGSMYQVNDKLRLAGVLTNLGDKMKFIDQADSLPLAFHLGGAYRFSKLFNLALEGVYKKTKETSAHMGAEWNPADQLSLRVGYRTDTTKGLDALAGLTMGVGFNLLGQQFSYAWAPMSDLGNTHYFSLLIKFQGGPSSR